MQGFDPQTILPRIAAQGLERQEIRPGDWFDDDGMLMCGKCGEPRQGMVTVSAPMEGNPENKMTFKATRSCKCDRDKEAAEKQAEQNKKDMERVARLKKASLMDEKLREASFDSFQVTKYNARNLKLCRRYAEAFDEMVSKNQGLIFWGSVGTGKSFAAACIANHLLNRGVPVMMTSLVKLLELIQGGEEKESDIIARMNSAKLVIFDDLGAERNTDYALEKIYNIIDSRYRRKLPMLLTTNLTIDEMKDEEDRRYRMAPDEIEAAYRYQEMQYRKADALRMLTSYAFGIEDLDTVSDEDRAEYEKEFETSYGITFEEAKKSIPEIVSYFFQKIDCNVGENTTWYEAIEAVFGGNRDGD